jgi:hypothetical protein
MTQQTSDGEFYTDEQKIWIMIQAIQVFNDLAPTEKQKVRKKYRSLYVDGERRRYKTPTKFSERLEMRYDRSEIYS